jgi:hypothetical protein
MMKLSFKFFLLSSSSDRMHQEVLLVDLNHLRASQEGNSNVGALLVLCVLLAKELGELDLLIGDAVTKELHVGENVEDQGDRVEEEDLGPQGEPEESKVRGMPKEAGGMRGRGLRRARRRERRMVEKKEKEKVPVDAGGDELVTVLFPGGNDVGEVALGMVHG